MREQKRTAAGRGTRMTKAERRSERARETVTEEERSTAGTQLCKTTEQKIEARTPKSMLAA